MVKPPPRAMHSLTTGKAPEGFEVSTSGDGHLVINRRRDGPRWFVWMFYALFGGWLLGWVLAGVVLSYQAIAAAKAPLWLAVLWWLGGIIVFWYVFGYAFWRLRSVTSYTFCEDELVFDNIFLTRRTRRKVERRDVRIVRQVYDGGRHGDLDTPSWGLLVEGPSKLSLLSHEEFETSAWLGPIVAQWAGVGYESSGTQ